MTKIKGVFTSILIVCVLLVAGISTSKHTFAQTSSCYDNVVMPKSFTGALPVILIHGYYEGSEVWSNWESYLKHDSIPYCTVSFKHSDDRCGSAVDHANELNQIVQRVKQLSNQSQVNIVGHSKGGLDARLYLSQDGGHSVANLVMIGTPNGGDLLADYASNAASLFPFMDFTNAFCRPALYDLETGAADTIAEQNPNVKYFTIYGDWNPSLTINCPPIPNLMGINWPELQKEGYYNLGIPNDGIVPASSVEALPGHTNLGFTHDCHTNLLNKPEYDLAKNVLVGKG